MKERQEKRHIQEVKSMEEELRRRELKNKKLRESRCNHEKLIEENKMKSLTKI